MNLLYLIDFTDFLLWPGDFLSLFGQIYRLFSLKIDEDLQYWMTSIDKTFYLVII